jgi:hypothetical protein
MAEVWQGEVVGWSMADILPSKRHSSTALKLASLQAQNSPFRLKQFALQPLHFAKSGYRRTPYFAVRMSTISQRFDRDTKIKET